MDEWTIYHNPRCSKSRQALGLLREAGIEPRVVEYLKTPPDRAELQSLLAKLGTEPQALVRTKEPAYRDAGLSAGSGRDELLAAIEAHPSLLERPIVLHGARGVIGRPPERLRELLP
jgi:arsenate reductase (glutaredoxin)